MGLVKIGPDTYRDIEIVTDISRDNIGQEIL